MARNSRKQQRHPHRRSDDSFSHAPNTRYPDEPPPYSYRPPSPVNPAFSFHPSAVSHPFLQSPYLSNQYAFSDYPSYPSVGYRHGSNESWLFNGGSRISRIADGAWSAVSWAASTAWSMVSGIWYFLTEEPDEPIPDTFRGITVDEKSNCSLRSMKNRVTGYDWNLNDSDRESMFDTYETRPRDLIQIRRSDKRRSTARPSRGGVILPSGEMVPSALAWSKGGEESVHHNMMYFGSRGGRRRVEEKNLRSQEMRGSHGADRRQTSSGSKRQSKRSKRTRRSR